MQIAYIRILKTIKCHHHFLMSFTTYRKQEKPLQHTDFKHCKSCIIEEDKQCLLFYFGFFYFVPLSASTIGMIQNQRKWKRALQNYPAETRYEWRKWRRECLKNQTYVGRWCGNRKKTPLFNLLISDIPETKVVW